MILTIDWEKLIWITINHISITTTVITTSTMMSAADTMSTMMPSPSAVTSAWS